MYEAGFDNTFCDLGYDRKATDWTVVGELISV